MPNSLTVTTLFHSMYFRAHPKELSHWPPAATQLHFRDLSKQEYKNSIATLMHNYSHDAPVLPFSLC